MQSTLNQITNIYNIYNFSSLFFLRKKKKDVTVSRMGGRVAIIIILCKRRNDRGVEGGWVKWQLLKLRLILLLRVHHMVTQPTRSHTPSLTTPPPLHLQNY